jgi:GT2 family glycosyltransferase
MGSIHTNLVTDLIRWGKKFEEGTVHFFFTYRVQPVDRARNQIVDFFLKGNYTHLFFIDSDTIPPTNALEKLIAHDKDIVSGMTPILHHDKEKDVWGTFFNTFWMDKNEETGEVITRCPEPNTGLVEIQRFGGSCLLIKRNVFEKMKRPYFQFILKEDGLNHQKSEDVYFADTARELGIKLWADTSVVCQHAKDVIL